MSRGYNFGAGPAALPEALLNQARDEMLEWQDCGMSLLEISHRSADFKALIAQAEQDLRDLLLIPNDYHVLFVSGPARGHFSAIPMNLLGKKRRAAYLVSGIWSEMASIEAKKYCDVACLANYRQSSLVDVFDHERWQIPSDAAYFYLAQNETISGVQLQSIPELGDLPVVADMTSCLLSEPLDVSRYGCLFAGAQKNIGPAGLTIVIVRRDLLTTPLACTPSVLDYQLQADNGSLFSTPASFNIYMTAKMFQWIKQQGGLDIIAANNRRKAEKLYRYIDQSEFYQNGVPEQYRSKMNITFSLSEPSLDEAFLSRSREQGLLALKGHRSVGGFRASLYNAMSEQGVDALIEFMTDFCRLKA